MAQPATEAALLSSPIETSRSIPLGYSHGLAVANGAGATFTVPCSAIYIGGAGNLNFTGMDNAAVTLVAPPVGSVLPLRARAIGNTGAGTTATNVVALW
jgi:hypothetical protein